VLNGERAIAPTPPWFVDNRSAATTGRVLASFAARPRWTALPGLVASEFRG
jgi:aldehyde dehydrogenase (NAD(P)+)